MNRTLNPDVVGVRLPVQPTTAMAVVRLVDQPDASASRIARLVEFDPAMSATVLRLANAPHLGLGRRVTSARQAVVLLGSKSVGSLAASGTASLVFGTTDTDAPEGFWAHAVTTAIAGANLARRIGGPADELFSLGLLHDLGSLLLHQRDPERFATVSEQAATRRQRGGVCELEQAAFGTDHVRLGADLIDRWNLPERFVNAVRLHHIPSPDVLPDTTSRLLAAAHALASTLDDGTPRERELDPVDALALLDLHERPSLVLTDIEREVHAAATFLRDLR